MKLGSLLSHVAYIRIRGSSEAEVSEITCDSREVKEGSLFVCIPGFQKDGHEFAGEALDRGASVIVVEEKNPLAKRLLREIPEGVPVVAVASSRKIFSYLSAAFYRYPLRSLVSVAVTGTKGKTTTAYMLREILRKSGIRAGLIGTNGAFVEDERIPLSHTTPEANELQRILRQMKDGGCTHVVMEVSSQGFKMERVAGLHFNCGIFTNLSPDHIGSGEHESFEDYLYQKSRLFKNCDVGIINREDKWADEITKGAVCRLISYGRETGDYRGVEPVFYKDSHMLGCEYRLIGPDGGENQVFLSLPGEYNVKNSLAAIAAAGQLGIGTREAGRALTGVHVPGRMELISGNTHLWILVDYAHNEISMENLLKTLKLYEPRRLICVFGCGGNRSRVRRLGMGRAAGKWADMSILTEDNSRYEALSDIIKDIEDGFAGTGGRYMVIPDRREAIACAIRHGKLGDIIAIIGKGHEDYQETEGKRIHFSDREEVEKALIQYR